MSPANTGSPGPEWHGPPPVPRGPLAPCLSLELLRRGDNSASDVLGHYNCFDYEESPRTC